MNRTGAVLCDELSLSRRRVAGSGVVESGSEREGYQSDLSSDASAADGCFATPRRGEAVRRCR